MNLRKVKLLSLVFLTLTTLSILIWIYVSRKKVDAKELLPAEVLAYLEIKNLRELALILAEKKILKTSQLPPEFSLGIVLTKLESEIEENSSNEIIMSIMPKFVAVLVTNYKKSTNLQLIEKLNSSLSSLTGSLQIKSVEKREEKWFVWYDENEKEKLFAVAFNGLIYFSNDESSLQKAILAKKGKAESLKSLEPILKFENENSLAFGYVKPELIPQVANSLGKSLAFFLSEDQTEQVFLAQAIFSIIKNSILEVHWKMEIKDKLVQDSIFVKTDQITSDVFRKTLLPGTQANLQAFVPEQIQSFTIYNFQSLVLAWRSLALLTTEKSSQQTLDFLNKLLIPYGISNPETFLNSISSEILIVKLANEEVVIITRTKDVEKLKRSLVFKLDFKKKGTKKIWYSKDMSFALAMPEEEVVILGETAAVEKCLRKNRSFPKAPNAIISTFTRDSETPSKLKRLFTNLDDSIESTYITETSFVNDGFHYKITSDFGLIGILIAMSF